MRSCVRGATGLACILLTFVNMACCSLRGALRTRADNEHVVLANCEDTHSGQKSSEVAYYSGAPGRTPDDISVLSTADSGWQQWANRSFDAYFADSGVTFAGQLDGTATPGAQAGTASNGYWTFDCYYNATAGLYADANKTCDMVYDCDHLASSSTTTPTTSSSASASAPPSPTASSSGDLSAGAIVGISVGTAVGSIFLLGIAAAFLWRRYRRSPPSSSSSSSAAEPSRKTLPEPPPPHPYLHEADAGERPPAEAPADSAPCELPGARDPAELASGPAGYDHRARWNMPPAYAADEEAVRGFGVGAYGSQKGPV
ncbi:hypothetical protein F4780DRAFT_385226 [Xylariomycetidae sp. FL0641]|nr:hypothetical protein F4780DRAFT_385226 [Xylariomycetidae sp. FL0641]